MKGLRLSSLGKVKINQSCKHFCTFRSFLCIYLLFFYPFKKKERSERERVWEEEEEKGPGKNLKGTPL